MFYISYKIRGKYHNLNGTGCCFFRDTLTLTLLAFFLYFISEEKDEVM